MQVLTIDTVVDYNNSKPVYANDTDACMDLKASLPVNELTIPAHQTEVIGSGVKCSIPENHVMMMFVRSSVGIKKGLVLANGTGIIDSDYAYSNNEGHIMIKLVNRGDKPFSVKEGEGFAQGIFLPYGITVDDDCDGVRNGGFGSTTD